MPRIKQTAKSLHGKGKGPMVKAVMIAKQVAASKKAGGSTGGVVEHHVKRRWRSGTVAKREIRKMSRSTHNLLKSLPFRRLIKGIASDIKPDIRLTAKAVKALQAGAEAFLPEHFMKADVARMHRQCKTLMVRDMKMAGYMTIESLDMLRHAKPGEVAAGEGVAQAAADA